MDEAPGIPVVAVNVSAFWEDAFAGREPGFRVDLKLKFKSREDGIAFLKASGVSTVIFTQIST